MSKPRQKALCPSGPGLVALHITGSGQQLLLLHTLLAGYDHLVSVHDDVDAKPILVTTNDQVDELRAVLAELCPTLQLSLPMPDMATNAARR